MIAFTDKIYYSDNIKERKRARLREKITRGRGARDIFCIASPSNPCTVFDIIPAKELSKQFYVNENVKVVGIAKGREEAEELVRQLVELLYSETSGFDAKSYFF